MGPQANAAEGIKTRAIAKSSLNTIISLVNAGTANKEAVLSTGLVGYINPDSLLIITSGPGKPQRAG
jgi:hypothetical protein